MTLLFFSSHGTMFHEYEIIFYDQFKEKTNYEKIVRILADTPLVFEEVSKKTKLPIAMSRQMV